MKNKYKKLQSQIEQLTQRLDRLDPPKPVENTEEVESIIIEEAKRRGFKLFSKVDRKEINKNRNSFSQLKDETIIPNPFTEDSGLKYNKNTEVLEFNDVIIYERGVWANIIEEPKGIDWTIAGQKVISVEGTVILTTGKTKNWAFYGVCLSSDEEENFVGEYRHWNKNAFKLYNEKVVL